MALFQKPNNWLGWTIRTTRTGVDFQRNYCDYPLMNYWPDRPPNTIDFSKLKKAQLQAYKDWFMASIDGRIAGLHGAVTSVSAFKTWEPDYSRDSLKLLGEWFLKNVKTRSLTESEIQAIKSSTPYDFGVPQDTLTEESFWLAFDIGCTLVRRSHPIFSD